MNASSPLEIQDFVARLGDEDPVVRCLAAKELGRAGPAAADAVDPLARCLADPDPMVRSMSASALGKIGEAARPAIGRLVEVLRDPVVPVRFWAADALGRIGDLPPEGVAALEETATDEHPAARPARSAARLALARLDARRDRSP